MISTRCVRTLLVLIFLCSFTACFNGSGDGNTAGNDLNDFYVVDQYNLELFFQGNDAFPVQVDASLAVEGGDGTPLTWMVQAGSGIALGRESGKAYFYVDPSSIDEAGSFVFFVGELCEGQTTPCVDQLETLNFMDVGDDGLVRIVPYIEGARRWQMRVYVNGMEFVSNDCKMDDGNDCEYVTALKGGELFAVKQPVGTSMNAQSDSINQMSNALSGSVSADNVHVQRVPLQAQFLGEVANAAGSLFNHLSSGGSEFWNAVRETAEQAGDAVRGGLEDAANTAEKAAVVASGEIVSGAVSATYDLTGGIQAVTNDVNKAALAVGGAVEDASRRAAYAVADGAVYVVELVERNACIIVTGGIASGAVAAISVKSEGVTAMARAALEGFKDFTKEQLIEAGKSITNPLVESAATFSAPALMLTGLNRFTSELIITAGLNNAIYGEPFVETPPTNREEAKEFATGLWQAFVVDAAINVRCEGGDIVKYLLGSATGTAEDFYAGANAVVSGDTPAIVPTALNQFTFGGEGAADILEENGLDESDLVGATFQVTGNVVSVIKGDQPIASLFLSDFTENDIPAQHTAYACADAMNQLIDLFNSEDIVSDYPLHEQVWKSVYAGIESKFSNLVDRLGTEPASAKSRCSAFQEASHYLAGPVSRSVIAASVQKNLDTISELLINRTERRAFYTELRKSETNPTNLATLDSVIANLNQHIDHLEKQLSNTRRWVNVLSSNACSGMLPWNRSVEPAAFEDYFFNSRWEYGNLWPLSEMSWTSGGYNWDRYETQTHLFKPFYDQMHAFHDEDKQRTDSRNSKHWGCDIGSGSTLVNHNIDMDYLWEYQAEMYKAVARETNPNALDRAQEMNIAWDPPASAYSEVLPDSGGERHNKVAEVPFSGEKCAPGTLPMNLTVSATGGAIHCYSPRAEFLGDQTRTVHLLDESRCREEEQMVTDSSGEKRCKFKSNRFSRVVSRSISGEDTVPDYHQFAVTEAIAGYRICPTNSVVSSVCTGDPELCRNVDQTQLRFPERIRTTSHRFALYDGDQLKYSFGTGDGDKSFPDLSDENAFMLGCQAINTDVYIDYSRCMLDNPENPVDKYITEKPQGWSYPQPKNPVLVGFCHSKDESKCGESAAPKHYPLGGGKITYSQKSRYGALYCELRVSPQ